jgi:hypothetical protein
VTPQHLNAFWHEPQTRPDAPLELMRPLFGHEKIQRPGATFLVTVPGNGRILK